MTDGLPETRLYRITINGKHWDIIPGTSANDGLRQVNERIGYSAASGKTIVVRPF